MDERRAKLHAGDYILDEIEGLLVEDVRAIPGKLAIKVQRYERMAFPCERRPPNALPATLARAHERVLQAQEFLVIHMPERRTRRRRSVA